MEKADLENKFKAYLEAQFRQIAPTKSAMEYRKSLLIKLSDRAQELRIKGMNDDELIYNTAIAELGDLQAQLRDYENKTVRAEVTRKMTALGVSVGLAYIVLLVAAYLIVGFVTKLWHPTWLIITGGLLLGLIGIIVFAIVKLAKKDKLLFVRGLAALAEVLLSTTVFLFLQLVGGINGSWMTFLVMVALIATVDTVLAFLSDSKLKWLELPVAIEIVCVMLYVILGLCIRTFWHPGWLLCLGGFVFAMVQIITVLARRASQKKKEEVESNTAVDESYWTKWD